MADKRYASIQNRIRLPSKISACQKRPIFQPLKPSANANEFELSAPLLEKTNGLIDQINSSFQIYQDPEDFRFVFPDTMFPDVPDGERNQITYEQKMVSEQENTFKDKLSEQQLQEIAEKGEFKVKSNIDYITLPYVWKINENLFWGRQRVQVVWNQSLAKIYGFFYQAKQTIRTTIPAEWAKIKEIPKRFFALAVGAKSLDVAVAVDYQKELFKDFWLKIMTNNYRETQEWGSALWKYLYVYYDPVVMRPTEYDPNNEDFNRRKREEKNELNAKYNAFKSECDNKTEKITKVHNAFNTEWSKLKKRVINQINLEFSNSNNSVEQRAESQEELLIEGEVAASNDDKVLEALAEKKFTLYVAHLEEKLPKEDIPINVVNAIVFMLRLFKVIKSRYENKQKTQNKRRKAVEAALRAKHPIKSLYAPFFARHVDAEMELINKGLENEMYESLKNDKNFTKYLKEDQLNAYKEYVRFRSNYNALLQAKMKQLPELHVPSRTFYSNHRLVPPYKVIQNSNGYYELKKVSDDLTVDTNTDFWKLKLYYMRVKTWTINCMIFLAFFVWKGPLGLRCLFGVKDFEYDMQIRYDTGEIYYETRKTVIGTFNSVREGMRKSRQNFQALPDLGLLGKNVSRIFNYLECYLFRFFFVGIILTLIGYPCLIVVSSVVSTVLVFTFWAWIPLILSVTYLFNILIYQFESSYIPNRLVIRSTPLLGLIFQIVKSLLIMLKVLLIAFVWVPLKSFLLLLFCFIQKMFRKMLDAVMLFMFRKLGRTPSRDTSIARKISGPGMSKEFYMSINEEDVYVLVRSELQRIYLSKFNELVESKLRQNFNRYRASMVKVFSPFSVNFYDGSNIVQQNMNKIVGNYQAQFRKYYARYPNYPYRVRFTQEQIDSYFENTVSIVRSFVEKNEIHGWIFDQYQLYEDMYDELTRSIWIRIFNCGEEIFEPLERLDVRFKLEDQYNDEDGFNYSMKKNVGSVMKALEGEVKLSHQHQRLAPFKHNLLNRELSTDQVSKILSLWDKNRLERVNLDVDNVETLFVPNLNINEVIIVDGDRRQRQIKANKNIVDL